MTPLAPCSALFPYTTLFRSVHLNRARRAGYFRSGCQERLCHEAAEPALRARNEYNFALECVHRFVTAPRSEEHTSELQSLRHLVCRLLLEKKKKPWKQLRQV